MSNDEQKYSFQDIYLLSDVKMLFEQQNCIETIVLQPFRIFRQICENIAHPAERFIFFSYKSTHPNSLTDILILVQTIAVIVLVDQKIGPGTDLRKQTCKSITQQQKHIIK